MHKALALGLLALSVSGCSVVTEIATFASCLEQIEAVFPQASGLSEEEFSGDVLGIGQVDSAGNFDYSVLDAEGGTYVGCKGNLESRRIFEVTFEGETASPVNSGNWSY
ncbi:MAG: hypothetical protein H6918_11065 [Sphingomonadaceae bacterium]|nr:hypothetical protein [Sphingomonadaceae bacterium]